MSLHFAEPTKNILFEDCYFYHVMDLPSLGTTSGQWDLRHGLNQYLGHYSFRGKKVLEMGPASGFLTFEIEKQGADVTCIEVPEDPGWDFVPYSNSVIDPILSNRREIMRKLKNSFWFAHHIFQSNAKLYYQNIYQLSESLGDFDVCILASILLHTNNPLKIIHECAKRSETIIIVDFYHQHLEGKPICQLHPNVTNKSYDTWWYFSTDFFREFLKVLGFDQINVEIHKQIYMNEISSPLFTMVASK